MTVHVIYSGGLDSTAALTGQLIGKRIEDVRAVGFAYGQTHVRELESARAIAEKLGVRYEVRHIDGIFHDSALLASDTRDIPLASYAAENIAETVVGGRNLLFASLAVAQASRGDKIVVGVHAGDHEIYGDCRPDFWTALRAAVKGAYGIEIVTPFLHLTKAEIVRLGAAWGAPLGDSWSCYVGGELHCGECATCSERRGAFKIAGVEDPTKYE